MAGTRGDAVGAVVDGASVDVVESFILSAVFGALSDFAG